MNTIATTKKTIEYGDRIFARVTKNGRTIYNFVSDRVSNLQDFIRELLQTIEGLKGLVVIHLRNYNQGWSEERPMMIRA